MLCNHHYSIPILKWDFENGAAPHYPYSTNSIMVSSILKWGKRYKRHVVDYSVYKRKNQPRRVILQMIVNLSHLSVNKKWPNM